LAWVLLRLAEHRWPVVIGRHDDGPWRKALAVQDALTQTDADVLVIHDADVVVERLYGAVEHVRDGGAWAMGHRAVYRLSEAGTALWLAGQRWADMAAAPLAEAPYLGAEGGGVTVVRRDVYEACSLDPRFVGWGSEDEAHGVALRTLYGASWRPTSYSPCIHLWHPIPPRATRAFGSLEGRDLRKRYIRAQHHPRAMRALIEEAKTHESDGSTECTVDDRTTVRG
jgi:hypothetical protein